MKSTIETGEYIHPAAIQKMRSEIAAAGGNEVFFAGKTDSSLMVTDISVLARGDGESVPAITRSVKISDVVIHNHPNGNIWPSKADLSIAAELGNRGVGFYIVDNHLETIYPVVNPHASEQVTLLEAPALASYILPDGPIAKTLKDYECRDEQCAMLQAVARALNEDRIALVEAGTGTGKSLAYLIPAITWSLSNKERVVISTNTINLQEQLMGKDLPLLRHIKDLRAKAVLVKGRSNYLCIRKLAATCEEDQLLLDLDGQEELKNLAAWVETTADGSLSDLNFIPRRENWERVCAEADQCTRLNCRFYNKCFFYKARREATNANILVVNHHLLMADLTVRASQEGSSPAGVLPRFQRIIIDEAQHMEDVATEYLGFHISKFAILKVLRRFQGTRDSARGLLPFVLQKLQQIAATPDSDTVAEARFLINDSIIPERLKLEERASTTFELLAEASKPLMRGKNSENGRTLRITPEIFSSPFWHDLLCPALASLDSIVQTWCGKLKELTRLLNSLSDRHKKAIESLLIEINALRQRLLDHLSCFTFFMEGGEGYCRWLEINGRDRFERLSLCAAPLDVAEGMRTAIYQRFGTVIMTSATLTVGGTFDYFTNRLGLKSIGEERCDRIILPSPFNYHEQAFIAAPKGVPEPDEEGYEDMLAEVVQSATSISNGGAFVLFTSYRLLERLYVRLEEKLKCIGLNPLKQGTENRTALLNQFRRQKGSVLFATDSFWEGVDVKGKALQCVILTRLPFRVPSEPVQQARVEAIEQAGGDAFLNYSVPQAVIKFRQGFGRLIRHRDDIGAVLILDARVRTRRYGKLFLHSLPAPAVTNLPAEGMLAAMKDFFAKHGGIYPRP